MGSRYEIPPERSRGSVLLCAVPYTNEQIAGEVEISVSMISHYKTGRRIPHTLERRKQLRDLYEIPIEAWDLPATGDAKTTTRGKSAYLRSAEGAPTRGEGARSTHAVVDKPDDVPLVAGASAPAADFGAGPIAARAGKLARIVDALTEKAEQGKLNAADAMMVAQKASLVLATLGRLTGETHYFDEARLVKMPQLRRVFERIAEVAKPWPDALQAIGEELKRMSENGET